MISKSISLLLKEDSTIMIILQMAADSADFNTAQEKGKE